MLGMIIDSISTFMYSKLLVVLLIGAGIYFTIRTKLPQMRLFKDACKAVVEKPEDENGVSSFQALMVSTVSRVGTGNIIGVSSAICIGGILAVITGWCLLGGGSRIVKVTSTLVPAMGVAYILIAVIVMIINHAYLPVVFSKIISEAFDFKAIFGAFAGSAMMCLSSGIAPAEELQGAPWVQAALQESLGSFGPLFITVAMVLFAFTTLLGNCFYCDNLLIFL